MPASPADRDRARRKTLTAAALLGASERARRMGLRVVEGGQDIRRLFTSMIPDYRRELEEYFLRTTLGLPVTEVRTWDWTRARAENILPRATASFAAMTDALEVETLDLLDEHAEDAYEEGYLLMLWDAYQQGVEVAEDVPDEFDRTAIIAGLLAAGIAGLSYAARARRWYQEARERYEQLLHAAIVGGDTLERTLQVFDGFSSTLIGRIEGLARNEIAAAVRQGEADALSYLPDVLTGMVWVSRWPEPGVCPICLRLHMTVTEKRPGIDSHPGCRCILLPLLRGTTDRPVAYETFVAQR